MCGRFTLTAPARAVGDLFGLPELPDLGPRYNVAPTQPVLAVRAGEAGREAVVLRWGLVPPWSAGPRAGAPLVNARAETVREKPAFWSAFARRRCLVLADGFYEWLNVGGKKQPTHFRLLDGRPFALAGLWEHWEGPGEGPVESCALLTTEANDLVRPVHERMPVLVAPEHHALWLGERPAGPDALRALLRPWPASDMTAALVNPFVNNARNEGPRCLELLGPTPPAPPPSPDH
jgi:putative SOS response-associated peptidase YedK